ncbi:hypothetical protein LTR84_004843 [Exophiala bonariae]|uniref:TauD/TfdA-like domain-containing protein n=1 Tax=Exophiala bonariae TaxID=1690606 RepID=A0AAV9NNN3_9EURO|nr:hypothetical protein LTR84_004843 [Exophiala bonariae]
MGKVVTSITFLKDLPLYRSEKPYNVLLAQQDDKNENSHPISNLQFEDVGGIEVHNLREAADDFSLDKSGFQLLSFKSNHLPVDSHDLVEAYRAETETYLCDRFDALKVICWEIRTRYNRPVDRPVNLGDALAAEMPAVGAHIDNTFRGGQNVVLVHLTDVQKAEYLNKGTWRPLVPVIEDSPLAVCDYRSVRKEDLIACDRIIPTRVGEIYYLKHKEHHQWYYAKEMTWNEMFMMVMFDSKEGVARCGWLH